MECAPTPFTVARSTAGSATIEAERDGRIANGAERSETTRLLALATAGAWTSVARLDATAAALESESVAEPAGSGQSERLLAMIGELIDRNEFPARIRAIAFDAGPGVFTGLRVGCSIAQGLGFASGLPLIPVGGLEAAAWRSVRQAGLARAVVLVANDARMGELYVAVCAVLAPDAPGAAPSVRLLVAPRIERPGAAPADLARSEIERVHPQLRGWPWRLAGDAWHGATLDSGWLDLAGSDPGSLGLAVAGPADARAIAEVALGLWREGVAVEAAEASPRYVRDKVALDVDEQRLLRRGRSG